MQASALILTSSPFNRNALAHDSAAEQLLDVAADSRKFTVWLSVKTISTAKNEALVFVKDTRRTIKKDFNTYHLKKDPMKSIELNAIDNANQAGLTMKLNYLKDIY